jgi:hypothetical protein
MAYQRLNYFSRDERLRKKATLGGEDRLCTGAKGRNTEGVERPSGETTIPGAPARLAESRLRGDGGENGNANRVGRVQTPLSGTVWQTLAGSEGARLPRAVRPEDTLPQKQVECQSRETMLIRGRFRPQGPRETRVAVKTL